MPDSKRAGEQGRPLDNRLVIIETLVFLLPALVLFYLAYQQEVSFDSSQVLILAGVLTLVLGGLLIVRSIFVQLRKLHQLVLSAFPGATGGKSPGGARQRDELDIMFASFSDLVSRYEITDTELRRSTADLDAVHRLTRIADRTTDLEELLGAVLTTAMEITDATAGRAYTVDEAGRAQQIAGAGTLSEDKPALDAAVEQREPVLREVSGHGLLCLPFVVRDECVAALVLAADPATLRAKTRPGQIFTLLVAEVGFALHNALLLKNLETTVVKRTWQLEQRNRDLEQEIQVRHETESRLAIAKRQAEEANYAKNRFLANMGHELLTPLGVIIGFADVLVSESHGGLSDDQRRYSRHILDSGLQLKNLVQDILTTVRLEGDDVVLDLQNCDAAAELTRALGLMQEAAQAKSISLHQEFDSDLPPLHVDPGFLEKLLTSLLGNAVKFSPENSRILLKARRITTRDLVSLTPDKPVLSDRQQDVPVYLLVEVSDQGRGYDHALSQKMFSLFEQGDNSRERSAGGSGLGLTMSHRIVTLHGGFLWAEGHGRDQGSSFFVALPVAPQLETQSERHEPRPPAPVARPQRGNPGTDVH